MRKILAGVALVFLAAGVASAQQNDPGASPTLDDLKTKVGFDEEQLKKAEPIVTEYTPKIKEAADKLKDAQDKKAAYGDLRTIKKEEMDKLAAICKDDDQKKKLADAFPARKKKNNNNN